MVAKAKQRETFGNENSACGRPRKPWVLFAFRQEKIGCIIGEAKGDKAIRGSKSTTAFEHTAASDLWRNTLSQIPTVFGQLVYLASLRNLDTGAYEHHGLSLIFGEEEANRALRESHSTVFADWLMFNLEQQKADLDLYLAGLFEDKRQVIETWVRLAPYKNLIPTSVRGVERRLYINDLAALIELFRGAYGVAAPDPDA
jgi:hypothetical protein